MSDTHNTDAVDVAPQASSSPGELLKRERETQGLSRDEVATALNLRPAVIAGLESDSYDEVPIAAYRRGYLRAYARLLGMEEGPVLQAYTSRFGKEEPERHTTPVQVTKPPSRLGAWLFKLVTLLVIAGLIGLTLMWWQSRGGSQPPDVSDSGPVSVDSLDGTSAVVAESPSDPDGDEALPPLPEEGVDPIATEAPLAPSPQADQPPSGVVDPSASQPMVGDSDAAPAEELAEAPAEASAPTESETAVEDAPAAEEPAAEEETPAAATTDETEAPAADPRVLEFTFNEQSWTEVFDADNQRIFVGLQEPGTTARVEGEPPFRLTVGNATGVELTWRGERVDLTARAGANNVARFTLGE